MRTPPALAAFVPDALLLLQDSLVAEVVAVRAEVEAGAASIGIAVEFVAVTGDTLPSSPTSRTTGSPTG